MGYGEEHSRSENGRQADDAVRYVTTPKHIQDVPEKAGNGDEVIIAYKPAETVKVADMEAVAGTGAHIRFALVADRDDLLVFLGTLLAQGGDFVFLDPSLPVPKRFADSVRTAPKKPARRKTPQKKAEPAVSDTGMKETEKPEKRKPAGRDTSGKAVTAEKKTSDGDGKKEKPEKNGAPSDEVEIGMNRPLPPADGETAETEKPVKAKARTGRSGKKAGEKPEEQPGEKKDGSNGEFSGAKAYWEKARAKCGL